MSRWWHRIRAWWDGLTGEAAEHYDALCLNPILLDALYEDALAQSYQRLRAWEPRALVFANLQPVDLSLSREIERLAGRVRVLCLQLQRLAHLADPAHGEAPSPDPLTCQRILNQYNGQLFQWLTSLEESVEACDASGWRAAPDRDFARRGLIARVQAANIAISAEIGRLAWTLPRSQPCLRAWIDPP